MKEKMEQPKKESGLLSTFFLYAVIGMCFALGLRFFLEPTIVIGQSMEPNLHEGEYLLNFKAAYWFDEPNYGDTVIVEHPSLQGHIIIKRVVGLPGDTVEIKDNQFYLNGEKMEEPYIAETMQNTADLKVVLGEDEIFVMGDNRNHSLDSRSIGPINYKENVRGKVIVRLYPFNQSFKHIDIARPSTNET